MTTHLVSKYIQFTLRYGAALLLAVTTNLGHAQDNVAIINPWIKATYPGQNISAGYMTLTSVNHVSLVKIESDVSDSVEIHTMKMENNVMKMRMLPSLELIAGKPYKLEPSSYHLMLFDLKKPLVDAQIVNLALTFKNKQGVEFKQSIKAVVRDAEKAKDVENSHSEHMHHHSH